MIILRPRHHGIDYMNGKGYYFILLQGICDDWGKFIDVFVSPPENVGLDIDRWAAGFFSLR